MATYIRRTAYNALLTPTEKHTKEENLTAIKREVERAIDAAIEEADWLGQVIRGILCKQSFPNGEGKEAAQRYTMCMECLLCIAQVLQVDKPRTYHAPVHL